MGIRWRKTVRRMMLLLVACSAFIVGSAAFHFYAKAAALLFTPKQTTPETTHTLMPRAAAFAPVYKPPFTFSTPEYQSGKVRQSGCDNCIRDKDCGICEILEGEYVNNTYMYMVTIPEEVQAMDTPPPAPAHGFMARVLADHDALIYVDGSYDAAFLNSAERGASEAISYLKEEYGQSVVVLERKRSALPGKRPAIRYKAQYTDNSTGVTMIEEAVVALRKDSSDEEEFGIIYTVTLRTPAYSQKQNHALFEKILKSWRELETDED